MIPEGALIRVALPASDTRIIDVIWEDKVLAVFADDLFRHSQDLNSVRPQKDGGSNVHG